MDQKSALLKALPATATFRLFPEALEFYGQGKRVARFDKQQEQKWGDYACSGRCSIMGLRADLWPSCKRLQLSEPHTTVLMLRHPELPQSAPITVELGTA
jgi:hypothetical protein